MENCHYSNIHWLSTNNEIILGLVFHELQRTDKHKQNHIQSNVKTFFCFWYLIYWPACLFMHLIRKVFVIHYVIHQLHNESFFFRYRMHWNDHQKEDFSPLQHVKMKACASFIVILVIFWKWEFLHQFQWYK